LRIPGLDHLRRDDPAAAQSLETLVSRLLASAEATAGALGAAQAFVAGGGGPLAVLVDEARRLTGAGHVGALRWTGDLAEGEGTVLQLAGDIQAIAAETPSIEGLSSTLLGRMLAEGKPVWRDRAEGSATLHTSESLAAVGSAGCVPVGGRAALYVADPRPGHFPVDTRLRVQALSTLAASFLDARVEPRPAPPAPALPGIVGESAPMRALYEAVQAFAGVPWPALILGESGTGKEAVARALHALSHRRSAPFVAFNAAAVPSELAESMLFGHERGAFTGAERRKEGVFERVDGGTLFLDEVGELPPRVQAAVLRVLQERRFERVGGTEELPFRGRVVAATWRRLDLAEERGTFREDLYHRLATCILRVPPLRERRGDIPALATHLLDRANKELGLPTAIPLSDAALRVLSERDWPGNVRELENTLREALARAVPRGETVLGADQMQRTGRDPATVPVPNPAARAVKTTLDGLPDGTRPLDLLDATDLYQRRLVRAALDACNDQRTDAAAWLGVSRPWLYRLLQRWGGKP
jgi:two-component system nitrogen regulation response regulator GlnG